MDVLFLDQVRDFVRPSLLLVFVFVNVIVGGLGAEEGSVGCGWGVGVVVPEMWGVLMAVGLLEFGLELFEEEEVEEERSVRIARRRRSLSGIVGVCLAYIWFVDCV